MISATWKVFALGLLAVSGSVQAATTRVVTVTTDNVPGVIYSLNLQTLSNGAISSINFMKNQTVTKTFTLAQAKSGITLMKEGPITIVSLKVDSRFDAVTGGVVNMKVMREFAFTGSDYRVFPMQIRREDEKHVLYSDNNAGLKQFDHLYMETFRKNDPQPTLSVLGTGDETEDGVGVKILQTKRAGRVVQTVNTDDL